MPQYLDGLSSIVIIDQAVGSGRTVDEAVETCKKFGVHDVVKVPRETKWYDQGYEFTNPATHPDEINMTSPYSEIMGEIGETAAKVVDTLGQELLAATA